MSYKWIMRAREFDMCCGVEIIFDFDEDDYCFAGSASKEEVITATIRELKSQENNARNCGRGLITATINHYQRKLMKPIFEKCGWTKVITFKNPNSGNLVDMYIKKLTKQRKRKAPLEDATYF